MNTENYFSDGEDSDTKVLPSDIVCLARIIHLLKETGLRLKLDISILSRVVDTQYYVIGSHTPFGTINPGTCFPMDNTYAEVIMREGKMFTYIHQEDSPNLGMHPVYQTHHLETFIGCPVRAKDGEILGTISFSSERLKKQDFSPYELAMVHELSKNPEIIEFLGNVEMGS